MSLGPGPPGREYLLTPGYQSDTSPLMTPGDFRRAMGLTQSKAAELLAVSLPTWKRWEKRGSVPRPWRVVMRHKLWTADTPEARKLLEEDNDT